jgi:hypothetical protein
MSSYYGTPDADQWGDGFAGIETMSRFDGIGGQALTSQRVQYAFFTPKAAKTVTKAIVATGATAAGASPSVVRIGLYTADASDNLTGPIVSTANDTALLVSSTQTDFEKALSATYTFIAGQRYAAALLVVSGTTMPAVRAITFNSATSQVQRSRVLSRRQSGQSDLTTDPVVGNLPVDSLMPWIAFE